MCFLGNGNTFSKEAPMKRTFSSLDWSWQTFYFLFVWFAASTSTMFMIAVHNVAYCATIWQNYTLGSSVYLSKPVDGNKSHFSFSFCGLVSRLPAGRWLPLILPQCDRRITLQRCQTWNGMLHFWVVLSITRKQNQETNSKQQTLMLGNSLVSQHNNAAMLLGKNKTS